jgi:hypothetical protein
MTPPIPASRASAVVRIAEAVGTSIKSLIVGAMLFIPGIILFLDEINVPQGQKIHTGHLSIAVGLMVGGAIAIQPPFGKQLTNIFVTVFPNGLPLVGGKRSTDPKPEDSQP